MEIGCWKKYFQKNQENISWFPTIQVYLNSKNNVDYDPSKLSNFFADFVHQTSWIKLILTHVTTLFYFF